MNGHQADRRRTWRLEDSLRRQVQAEIEEPIATRRVPPPRGPIADALSGRNAARVQSSGYDWARR